MHLATLVMISIYGFMPGYRWHTIMSFTMKDMATCRAQIGITHGAKLDSHPMDRQRFYVMCIPVSPRLIASENETMRGAIKPWSDMKIWTPWDMLDKCACVAAPNRSYA